MTAQPSSIVLPAVAAALAALAAEAPYLDETQPTTERYDDAGTAQPYLRARDVPAPRRRFGLNSSTVQVSGFVQVDVEYPLEGGEFKARALAERVVGLFPLRTRLGPLKVEEPAYASAPVEDTPYWRIPVTIPYSGWVSEG